MGVRGAEDDFVASRPSIPTEYYVCVSEINFKQNYL